LRELLRIGRVVTKLAGFEAADTDVLGIELTQQRPRRARFSGSGSGTMSRSLVART
jgi:hypothetical protein